jgi:hypothetical protein
MRPNPTPTPVRHRLLKPLAQALAAAAVVSLVGVCQLRAESCTTQSQMKPAERDAIAASARALAALVQTGDAAGLREQTVPEYAKDFSGMASLVASTAPHLKGASLTVEQLYLLDATNLKTLADGTNQDAQFFCSLNKSPAEANFLIPSLPPGRYAFVMVAGEGTKAPWRLSLLLRQSAAGSAAPASKDAGWQLAGLYPKPLTAAGHDGLWYWTHARDLAKQRQLWAAYLYYQQAEALLQPAGFVTSTHFDTLHTEAAAATPPALSAGISPDVPLVVKGAGGAEFRFTALTTDDSLGADQLDVLVHLAPDPPLDAPGAGAAAKPEPKAESKAESKPEVKSAKPAAPLSPTERNNAAMAALIAAYPELRGLFHGVWVFADLADGKQFITEQPMANIH